MDNKLPPQSVFLHFRFKFLAITCVCFLLYVVLSSSHDINEFAKSPQFMLMGPFFIGMGLMFLLFRKFPIKCPHCYKINATKKDWTCPNCGKKQGRERYLVDKCLHCKQMLATYHCEHCKKEFKL